VTAEVIRPFPVDHGPHADRPTIADALAFAAAVLLFLIFSQGWVAPILGTEKPDAGTSALIRSLYYPAYAAALAVMALNLGPTIATAVRSPVLIALLLVVAASMTWSISPDQTSRRVVALAFTTASGVVLAARFSWRALAEAAAVAFAILAVISFLVGLFVPSMGRMDDLFPGSWRGLWPEKNALGGNMAIAFVVFAAAAVLNPPRRWTWWGFAFLAVLLVLASTSKTSLVCLLLAVGALAFVALVRRGPAMGVATTWTAVLGAGLLALAITFAADVFFELLGKDPTFTGRTKIWDAALRQIAERPWTGFGYGAVWENTDRWSPLPWMTKDAGFEAEHAHNAWLDPWLGFGLVGLVVWAAYFLETWVRTVLAIYRDGPGRDGAWFAFPFLCVFSLMSLTESIAVSYNDLRWMLFVMLATKLAAPLASEQRR
jgi:O-antigen ligase